MRLLTTVKGKLACGLTLATALALGVAPAAASIMRFLPIEELARESTRVVRARVTDRSVHWTPDHKGIYTEIDVVVIGPALKWSGGTAAAAAGRRLTIVQAGGTIDGISLDWTGRPTFERGEDLILFLQEYDENDPAEQRLLVVGGKQGRMRVVPDEMGSGALMVQRDLVGVMDAPFIEDGEPSPGAHRRDRIGLDELRARVAGAAGGIR